MTTRRHDPFDPLDGPIVDTLDLHGLTGLEAKSAVASYLARVRKRHPGELVHVITGKGRNSAGTPVLKPAVRSVLAADTSNVARWGRDYDDGGFLVRLSGGMWSGAP